MTQVNIMKSEIPVFMATVDGFFNTFSWDFHEKKIHTQGILGDRKKL